MTADINRDDGAQGEPPAAGEENRRHSAQFFAVLHDPDTDSSAQEAARDGLVHLHLALVQHCARRFRKRGEPYEDLV